MTKNWLCRINRHSFTVRHNPEDEKLTYLECVRCKKQRHYGATKGTSDLRAFMGGTSGPIA